MYVHFIMLLYGTNTSKYSLDEQQCQLLNAFFMKKFNSKTEIEKSGNGSTKIIWPLFD